MDEKRPPVSGSLSFWRMRLLLLWRPHVQDVLHHDRLRYPVVDAVVVGMDEVLDEAEPALLSALDSASACA